MPTLRNRKRKWQRKCIEPWWVRTRARRDGPEDEGLGARGPTDKTNAVLRTRFPESQKNWLPRSSASQGIAKSKNSYRSRWFPQARALRGPLPRRAIYFLRHQSNMPPMRPPVSNAFFCFASRLS